LMQGAVDTLMARAKKADEEVGDVNVIAGFKIERLEPQKLADSLVQLALPQGKWAILLPWSSQAWTNSVGESVSLQLAPELDQQWLTVVAPTRQNLARLESLQLSLERPLDALCSHSSDPWCRQSIQEIQAKISNPTADVKNPMDREVRVWVGYGDAAVLNAAAQSGVEVAVGLIDSFHESIPVPQVTTTAAFGFNAPASRAPQALRLAVSPVPRLQLDPEMLCEIVQETRELAHARSARLENLPEELQFLTPAMWLKSFGAVRMHLEDWPLFDIEEESVIR
ncbi:MAG: hypothetical protein ACKPEY_06555, partial [Planctomycetota bacterium]